MIKIKTANLREKIGKNLSEIARETGLNRNTINGIFLEKVDGIKFDTLEKLCDVYDLQISDIVEFTRDDLVKTDKDQLYRQEGECAPFTCWSWMLSINNLDSRFFDQGLGRFEMYFKGKYGVAYWRINDLYVLAKNCYKKYSSVDKANGLYEVFLSQARELEDLYQNHDQQQIINMPEDQLQMIFRQVRDAYRKMWSVSLFIDAFDAGFDHEQIDRLTKKFNLSVEEVAVLTTPEEMTFNNDRFFALLKIVKNFRLKKVSPNKLDKTLSEFIATNPAVKKYIKDFDYYKSNYVITDHITVEEIKEEMKKYLSDDKLFKTEYRRMENYASDQKAKIAVVLRQHKLKENPLYFFNKLTIWREYRKRNNLMGIHLLDAVLDALEKRTGIAKKYLYYISFDEFGSVIRGLLTMDVLEKRYELGVIISIIDQDFKMIEGDEAISLKNDLDQLLLPEANEQMLAGKVASQGYARGLARIIVRQEDFSKFKEGEILVTVMTRPEYVPIMKKAAAIVTDEGGITCHAAIVSRELGKPCIIGTRDATKLIHDGDLIEVRANHGTVRILERAK